MEDLAKGNELDFAGLSASVAEMKASLQSVLISLAELKTEMRLTGR